MFFNKFNQKKSTLVPVSSEMLDYLVNLTQSFEAEKAAIRLEVEMEHQEKLMSLQYRIEQLQNTETGECKCNQAG